MIRSHFACAVARLSIIIGLALPVLLTVLLASGAARAEPPAPPPDVKVDWAKFGDLEMLVRRVENEGMYTLRNKVRLVAQSSWGRHVRIAPAESLAYPIGGSDEAAQVAFLQAYVAEYDGQVEAARTAAVEAARTYALLAVDGLAFAEFTKQFQSRYKVIALNVSPRDDDPETVKKRVSVEIARFLTRAPEWEKETRALRGATPEALARLLAARAKTARKVNRYFDIAPDQSTSELRGTGVFDIRFQPDSLQKVWKGFYSLAGKTFAVVDEQLRPWSVNGLALEVCESRHAAAVNAHLGELDGEYAAFFYRKSAEPDREVIRIVHARLWSGTRTFLVHGKGAILFVPALN